jgi:hypothetical protein
MLGHHSRPNVALAVVVHIAIVYKRQTLAKLALNSSYTLAWTLMSGAMCYVFVQRRKPVTAMQTAFTLE